MISRWPGFRAESVGPTSSHEPVHRRCAVGTPEQVCSIERTGWLIEVIENRTRARSPEIRVLTSSGAPTGAFLTQSCALPMLKD